MAKDKVQKKRVVIWETTDKRGNDVAFASIDMRAPPEPTDVPSEEKP